MARPLRINIEEGWYHVMSRGIERRTIFIDHTFFRHFIDLLGEMTERFGVEVHAYVLMDNHYHLILRTPKANASQAMQWLNVSYSVWFNTRLQRVGHVFQGRFRSTLIDGEGAWLLEASAYVHLNPVRVSSLGLEKSDDNAESLGMSVPDRSEVQKRLFVLRTYPWSSYRVYGKYAKGPDWLRTGEILKRAGGSAGYRQFVQQHLTRGQTLIEFSSFTGVRLAVGYQTFLKRVREQQCWINISREQPDRSFFAPCVPFETIMSVVETEKGEPWSSFQNRHGDWGLPLVLYLARLRSGLTLQQIGDRAGGMTYKAVFERVRRFKAQLEHDSDLKKVAENCMAKIWKMEM